MLVVLNYLTNSCNVIKKINIGLLKNYSKLYQSNLLLVDSDLVKIYKYILKYIITYKEYSMKHILEYFIKNDPIGYGTENSRRFYNRKLTNFVSNVLVGMTDKQVWKGESSDTLLLLIRKKNKNMLCYHSYNYELQSYLIDKTKFFISE